MSIHGRSWLGGFLVIGLIVAFGAATAAAQESQADPEQELRRIIGNWALNPIAEDAPAPKPPPIYASYRKKGEAPPPALETIPRVFLELKEGKVVGKAVLPSAYPMTDENRDVSGKEAVDIADVSFEGGDLKFKVIQGNLTFEATGRLEGRVIKGNWSLAGSDKKGALFMHRRYR